MHGVNLDQLGGRDPDQYGTFTLPELEATVAGFAEELGLEASLLPDQPRGRVRRAPARAARARGRRDRQRRAPGPTTRGRSATRSSSPACPAVEVHISDISKREEWRRETVFAGLTHRPHLRQAGAGLPRGARADRRAPEEVSAPTAADARAARLAELVAAAGARRALRLRPDQRPLPDRASPAPTAPAWSGPSCASSSPTSATPSAPSRRWGRAGSGPRPSASCCPRSPRG